jgi:isopenicillin-N N-acyltransferase like protein
MRTKITLFLSLNFIIFFNLNAANDTLRIIRLEGTAYERGLKYGEELKPEINAMISDWVENIEKSYNRPADSVINEFIETTGLYTTVEKYTPDLIDELRGLSDGSGVALNRIKGFQIAEELGTFGKYHFIDHCSSIGIKGDKMNPTIVAQNIDLPPFLHKESVVLHIIDNERQIESFVYTYPGGLGCTGINSKSIGITVNAIGQLNWTINGLPVVFVIRGLLMQKDFTSASQFLNEINHSTPQNYLVGGIDNVTSFECSANKVASFSTSDTSKIIYHTNHPLVNSDFQSSFIEKRENKGIPIDAPFKCVRYEYLDSILGNRTCNVDIDSLKNILSVRETYINNFMTFGSLIMVLENHPYLLVAPKRPDENDYLKLEFEKY